MGSKKTYLIAAATVTAVAAIVIYFSVDPAEASWMPKCLFYQLTGYKCAGCGSQRAIHALLHGDLTAAWNFNALLVVAIAPLLFLAWLELRRTRHPRLYARIHTPAAIAATATAIIAWTIFRNL